MMRFRCAGSMSASRRSIIGSFVGSSFNEPGEQPALVGVGADDERHAVRLALRASPAPDQAAGSRCRRSGRPRRRRASRAVHARSARRARSPDRLAGPPSPRARRPPCVAPSSAANRRRTPPPRRVCPTIPLAGLSEIAWAKRPLAAGTASSVATACAPALSPKIVTLSGSPPKTAMLSRTQCNAITRSRRNRLSSIGVVAGRQRRQVQAAQRAEPVVHRHVHAALPRQRGAVVDRRRRTAEDVAAAVDEDHHRQSARRGGRLRRRRR